MVGYNHCRVFEKPLKHFHVALEGESNFLDGRILEDLHDVLSKLLFVLAGHWVD